MAKPIEMLLIKVVKWWRVCEFPTVVHFLQIVTACCSNIPVDKLLDANRLLSSLQLLDCYSILPGSQQFCKGNLDFYVSCAEQKRGILDISMVFINGVQSKFHSIRKFPIKTRSGHYFGIIVLNIYRHTMYRNMDFIYQYISNYVLQIHGWITKKKSIMSTR